MYSVPSKTEGRRKALWEWKGIKLSFTCGGNPIPTCDNIEHSGNVEKKSVNSPSQKTSPMFNRY